MENLERPYPSISQAAGLLFVTFAISLAVGLPHALLSVALPQHLRDSELVKSALGLIVYALPLVFAVRMGMRNRASGQTERPGLKLGRVPVGTVAILCAMTVFLGMAMSPLLALLPRPEWYEQAMSELARPNVFSFVCIVIAAPLLEELLFRGIILDGLLKNYGPAKAIIASAVMFGVFHLNPWQGVVGLVLGLFLGWVYWKTQSVMPCIFIHATYNLVGYLLMAYVAPDVTTEDLMSIKAQVALFLGASGAFAAGGWWLGRRMRRHAVV
jgi:hypothetical protein